MAEKPQVGVAIILTRDDKVLLMKRKGPHAPGTWSTPGGHIDYGETPEQCAVRETKEEVGVDVTDIRFRCVTSDVYESEGKHYITIWMDGKTIGEPYIASEKEAAELGWFAWDALPEPLMLSMENLVKQNSYPPK